jgi:hypothetical protein
MTVVLLAGGDGLLLLKDRHPASASGSNRAIRARRIGFFLQWHEARCNAGSAMILINIGHDPDQ